MKPYRSINPTTGSVEAEYPPMARGEIARAVAGADAGYRTWSSRGIDDRSRVLSAVARTIRTRGDDLAALATREMGKTVREARGEVELVARIFDYYASQGPRLLEPEHLQPASGDDAKVILQPVGVLLGIMPWNYPYYQIARFAAPNILLGNSILLKHARNVPQCALAFEQVLHDAGVPRDVYVNLFADTADIESIIADPRVQGVSLTGSEAAGAVVAEAAGRHLTKVVLELGGSDPFLVLDDADLDATVTCAVTGRITNAGQACTAAKRFIVLDRYFDDFVDRYARRCAELTIGDPARPDTELGPMSSEQALAEVHELVDDAVSHGAVAVCGGRRSDREGAFYEPTLLTGVDDRMRVHTEEVFGPVAVAYRVASIDEAVALANQSPYGLGAAVFTSNTDLAEDVAARLDVGMVTINGTNKSQPDLPFGGIKRSGVGRELGRFGLEEFANRKLIRKAAAA
ncbi:MAG TPA: NAD-dependent succinate-semialdehyde dehydrogenase [Aldersonia sp.]